MSLFVTPVIDAVSDRFCRISQGGLSNKPDLGASCQRSHYLPAFTPAKRGHPLSPSMDELFEFSSSLGGFLICAGWRELAISSSSVIKQSTPTKAANKEARSILGAVSFRQITIDQFERNQDATNISKSLLHPLNKPHIVNRSSGHRCLQRASIGQGQQEIPQGILDWRLHGKASWTNRYPYGKIKARLNSCHYHIYVSNKHH